MQYLQPHNKNYLQAVLYQAGQQKLGAEEAQASFDEDVRAVGARRLGSRILLAAGTTVFALTNGLGLGSGPSEPTMANTHAAYDEQNQALVMQQHAELLAPQNGTQEQVPLMGAQTSGRK